MFSYFEPLRLKNERVHVDPLVHKPFQKNKFLRYASFNKYFFSLDLCYVSMMCSQRHLGK